MKRSLVPAQLQQSSGLILLLPEEPLGTPSLGDKQCHGWCPLPAPWDTKHLLHHLNTADRKELLWGQLWVTLSPAPVRNLLSFNNTTCFSSDSCWVVCKAKNVLY